MTDVPPPDDELVALFREEAAQHVFSGAMRETVLRGVEHAVLLAPVFAAGAGAGAGAAAAAAAAKAWTTKSVVLFAALSFGIGAVAGVVGTKAISPPSGVAPSTPLGETPRGGVDAGLAAPLPAAPSSSPSGGSSPSDVPSTSPAVPGPREGQAPRPLGPVPSGSSARSDASPSTLARESEIIETGRAALARGRAADALAAADEHRRLFPRGRLSEEREELAIRALRAAGRSDEARARAKAFLKAYPSSIYSGTVGDPAD